MLSFVFSFVENTRRNFTSAAEKGITAAAMDMGYFTARSVKDTSVPALKAPIQAGEENRSEGFTKPGARTFGNSPIITGANTFVFSVMVGGF